MTNILPEPMHTGNGVFNHISPPYMRQYLDELSLESDGIDARHARILLDHQNHDDDANSIDSKMVPLFMQLNRGFLEPHVLEFHDPKHLKDFGKRYPDLLLLFDNIEHTGNHMLYHDWVKLLALFGNISRLNVSGEDTQSRIGSYDLPINITHLRLQKFNAVELLPPNLVELELRLCLIPKQSYPSTLRELSLIQIENVDLSLLPQSLEKVSFIDHKFNSLVDLTYLQNLLKLHLGQNAVDHLILPTSLQEVTLSQSKIKSLSWLQSLSNLGLFSMDECSLELLSKHIVYPYSITELKFTKVDIVPTSHTSISHRLLLRLPPNLKSLELLGIESKPWMLPELGLPEHLSKLGLRHVNLQNRGHQLPRELVELSLIDVDLSEIAHTMHWGNLPALRKVDLRRNGLSYVDMSRTSVTDLKLSLKSTTRLRDIKYPPCLQHLQCETSPGSDNSFKLFSGALKFDREVLGVHLHLLDLSNIPLKIDQWTSFPVHLQSLKLSNCQLKTKMVEKCIFGGKLQTLDLSRNRIEAIDLNTLPQGLHHIDLLHNRLKRIQGLVERFEYLQSLHLRVKIPLQGFVPSRWNEVVAVMPDKEMVLERYKYYTDLGMSYKIACGEHSVLVVMAEALIVFCGDKRVL